MHGRPKKAHIEDRSADLLQVGDRFRFAPDTVLAGRRETVDPKDMKAFLAAHDGFEQVGVNIVQWKRQADDTEYVVVSAELSGGGTGHGLHDVYPDGWHVTAVPLGTSVEFIPMSRIVFYQSGCFTSDVMPAPVILTKRVDGAAEPLQAGKA